MGSYDLLVRLVYNRFKRLLSDSRLDLKPEEREKYAKIALDKIERGDSRLIERIRNTKDPIPYDRFVPERTLAELLPEYFLIPKNGHGKSNSGRKKPKNGSTKSAQKAPSIDDLFDGEGVEIKPVKPVRKKKRKLKVSPEPYKREAFYVIQHAELLHLRRKFFRRRLEIMKRIAKLSGYIRLVSIKALMERVLQKHSPLEELLGGLTGGFDGNGRIAGLVFDKRSTNSGFVITLEDEYGTVDVFVPKDLMPNEKDRLRTFYKEDGSKISLGELIIPDEVIFVEVEERHGKYIAKDIRRPGEVLANVLKNECDGFFKDRDFSVVFLSDTHVGSKNSIARKLERFRERLKNPSMAPEAYKDALSRVELVLVGGDLVDGVGVFPGQEAELEIVDPEEQYRLFGEIFSRSPVDVIAIPGNHDPTTLIVPQPVPEDALVLKEYGIKITHNPAVVEYDGFRVLMYHGRSLEDLVLYVPLKLDQVIPLMKRLALSNLLTPIYGEKESFRPDENSPLVIARGLEDYPHVLFMGHIHIAGHGRFGKMFLINGGTMQTMPEEKNMPIKPTPGKFVVLDLKNRTPLEISILRDFLQHAPSSGFNEFFDALRILGLPEDPDDRLGT